MKIYFSYIVDWSDNIQSCTRLVFGLFVKQQQHFHVYFFPTFRGNGKPSNVGPNLICSACTRCRFLWEEDGEPASHFSELMLRGKDVEQNPGPR